jgi:hypothetical protein
MDELLYITLVFTIVSALVGLWVGYFKKLNQERRDE